MASQRAGRDPHAVPVQVERAGDPIDSGRARTYDLRLRSIALNLGACIAVVSLHSSVVISCHAVPETAASRWLVLIHQIPPNPSYLRVKVGRRLQGLGAVAVKNSVYVLPPCDP